MTAHSIPTTFNSNHPTVLFFVRHYRQELSEMSSKSKIQAWVKHMILERFPHVFNELNLDQPDTVDFTEDYLHLFIPVHPLDNSQKYDRRLEVVLPSLY